MTFKVKSGIRVNTTDVIDQFGNFTGNSYLGTVPVAVAKGGTGANNAANARINLFDGVPAGLVVKVEAGNVLSRTLESGTGVVITNADGGSGNPQISIGQNVATTASVTFANVALTSVTDGFVVRSSTGNLISRTFVQGTGVTITNTDGSGDNPEFSIGQDVSTSADVRFANITVDGILFSNDITATTITAQGDLRVVGNLVILGNTTTLNTEVVAVEDNEIVLNSGVSGAPTLSAFLTVNRGSESNSYIKWNEDTDRWQFTNDGSAVHNIPVPAEYANTIYTVSAEDGGALAANLVITGNNRIDGSVVNVDKIRLVGSGLVTVSATDANTITISAGGSLSTKVLNVNDSVANVLDSFSMTLYRSAEYFYTVENGSTKFATGKILVLHDGSSTYHTQFAMLQSDSADEVVTFQTDTNAGLVRLIGQSTSGNLSNVTLTSTQRSAI